MKGGERAPPPRANFTLMMECPPESSRCYSVYSVVRTVCAGPVYPPAATVTLTSPMPTPPVPPAFAASAASARYLFYSFF